MPWKASQARQHTKRAKSKTAKRQWAKVANSVLRRTGSDRRAIKAANSALKKRGGSKRGKR